MRWLMRYCSILGDSEAKIVNEIPAWVSVSPPARQVYPNYHASAVHASAPRSPHQQYDIAAAMTTECRFLPGTVLSNNCSACS